MDRSIYTAMTGAKALLQRQETISHNLANASTTGFRADMAAYRSVPVRADGTATTRVASLEATSGFDASQGPLMSTGRSLDVALKGPGYFAVQGLDGNEAYTRDGSFVLAADGTLQTGHGMSVVGEGGAITIPPGMEVSIGADGTVSAKGPNQPSVMIGKIKLVDAPAAALVKGGDGLLRARDGEALPDDPSLRVSEGMLEGSNVNAVEAMVGMIALSRQFEIQMKMMQSTEANEQKAAQLLSLKS